MSTVGSSVPARRPFFKPDAEVPALIKKASAFATDPIFVYSLAGGWPTINSVIRLITSLIAVISAFSFAVIATLLPKETTRRIFAYTLLLLSILALACGILDALAIARVGIECSRRECKTGVPNIVLNSGNICSCSVEGWFFITLLADGVLMFTALVCCILTAHPRFAPAVSEAAPVDPTQQFSNGVPPQSDSDPNP